MDTGLSAETTTIMIWLCAAENLNAELYLAPLAIFSQLMVFPSSKHPNP
jgi:hypothetical protein